MLSCTGQSIASGVRSARVFEERTYVAKGARTCCRRVGTNPYNSHVNTLVLLGSLVAVVALRYMHSGRILSLSEDTLLTVGSLPSVKKPKQ